MGLKRICAWCHKDLGEVDDPESGLTHGICPSCIRLMKAKSILQKEHLVAGLALEEDDDVIKLKKSGQVMAIFSRGASREAILEEADKYREY